VAEITNARELFVHELGDILDVERKLVSNTLPQLIEEVDDEELRSALEDHLKQTRTHARNVEKVFELLHETSDTEVCLGFKGLKKEHAKLTEESSAELADLIAVAAAARTESYEIAAYEVLRRLAKGLGEDEAVELLDQNLREEKDALRIIERIGTRVSNDQARTAA
jgi:ferritin-like metal-binding protein YciE